MKNKKDSHNPFKYFAPARDKEEGKWAWMLKGLTPKKKKKNKKNDSNKI